MRKKIPDYLLRMIDDYLSERWVLYEGDKWSLKEKMTCGAPQGSRVGPLVWNVMYDDFLRMDLPAGTSIIGFANDTLVVCAADDVRILELRVNESLWQQSAGWIAEAWKWPLRKPKLCDVTDRRSFQYPEIVLGEQEVEWKTSIKYLEVQLDRRLSFGEHLKIATAKAIQCGANLARLMPNIGGPREAERRPLSNENYFLPYMKHVWPVNHFFKWRLSRVNFHLIYVKTFQRQLHIILAFYRL